MQFDSHVGKHRLVMSAQVLGQDLLVAVYGGDEHHIGGVAVAYPARSHYRDAMTISVSTLTLPGHKDYLLASSLAERICKSIKRITAVTVGIHIDNASQSEIEEVIEASNRMADELVDRLRAGVADHRQG
ncbi:MAG: hypothetical protein HXY34_09640 [Candidatus Thorarchaeota archaeon]|nr:hypothetical protein [Candidatus Thorarchaeota archaeon]